MRIILIRHGDPDNPNNTLTPQGFKEVEALGNYLKDFKYDKAYVSPLARARITSEAVLSRHNDKAEMKEWLQEFIYPLDVPYQKQKQSVPWDLMPSFYLKEKDLYDPEKYLDHPVLQTGNVKEHYNHVCHEFDKLLEEYGYVRHDNYYDAITPNKKTIILFCHFGVMTVIMSHLMNIPYIALADTMICLPTGITTFITEEREQGRAIFRCNGFGDISHLNIASVSPSFHGRFCETYDSFDERH